MPARVELSHEGQHKSINKDGEYTGAEIQYLVFSAADENDALKAVLAEAPAEFEALSLDSIEIDARERDDIYRVNAIYKSESGTGNSDDDDNDEATVSFDCGGGTKHLNYSIAQRRVFGDKEAGGAIGWNGKPGDDCEIAGVDVPTAQLRETYTKSMKLNRLTTSYKRNVAGLVGKVNSGSFKGWNAGEVMFLGMSYSTPARKAKRVTVTFNFAIQPNESGVKVGGKGVGNKGGFEYIWAISKTTASGDIPKIELEGIYIDQVCDYASFSALGL